MENLSKKRKPEVFATSMPEGVPFGFPLRRISHLKSETFTTLVRIFSLCVNESEAAQHLSIVSDAPDPGTRSEELEKVAHQEAQVEKSMIENDPLTNQRAEVIDVEPSTSSFGKDISVHSVAFIDRSDDNLGVSQTVAEESVQGAEEMEINQQSFSFEISEATQPTEKMEIDKQLNGGILEESTQVEDTQVPSVSLVQNAMDELANEIQQKEANLRKPVNMEANRDAEDGEIPDDSWDTDLSFDMFLEDVLINEMKLGEDQIPGEHTKRGEFHDVCSDKKQADVMHSASTSYLVDMVEQKKSDGEFQETRKLQQAYGDDFLLEARKNNKIGDETKGGFSFPLTYADNLSYPVKTSEKTMIENEGIMSAEMDSESREKKKRGPRTKEYKANKKKKERKKRATKERQQGVKRLRIQPIIKPKIKKFCEFHLKRRCQKGDKCKFSHDITPPTISEPCKYLAVQSCLKGDNCPYDHQLSKYPCNNIITKGTCHRGDACLFSHKPVEASPSNSSQNDSKSQPLSGFTSTRNPQNSKNTSFQNPRYISKETTVRTPIPVGTGSQSHLEQKVLGRFKPPAQPTKGITLLSFGKSSLNESDNRQQGDIPCSKEKGIETRNQEYQNTSSKGITLLSFRKSSLSESSDRQPGDIHCNKEKGVETRNQEDQNTSSKGITLLSFGKSSLSESSDRQPGNIHCNKEKGVETRNTSLKGIPLFSFGKSSLNESSNWQQGEIPCHKEKGIETWNPKDQNTSPKGITRFSFGKSSLNESSNRQQGDIPCNKEKLIETRNPKDQTSEKPQSSNNLLWKSPSTPLPLSQSANPLRNWQNTNTTDSIQKRLLSTLSFAAKHESETVMGQSKCAPSLIPVEANKPPSDVAEATKTPRSDSSSSSVNVPEEWKNASPVLLEFLFASSGNR